MEQSKKIYVSKTDSLASIVGKIVKAKEEDIILYIPRGTEFAASRTNFVLLKREVGTAGKNIMIESVDEDALELADIAGIKAVNPFMRRRQRAVSDIVVVTSHRSFSPRSNDEKPSEIDKKEEREVPEIQEDKEPEPAKLFDEERKKFTPRRLLLTAGTAALLAGIVFLAVVVLPRAKIELTLEKKNLDFVGSVLAGADIKENNFSREEVKVRGVAFVEKKNITKAYPASGKKQVERKAAGEVIIYNNYSTAPQVLVATTRLITSDGKLYRLNNTVTVPGKSSIRAAVTADKPGVEYNLSSGVKFRIPGFQGSPKYDAFYAELKESLTGGFVGESSLPSEADLEAAKKDAEQTLEEAAKTQLLLNLPPEIKVLNNAYQFKITDTKVNETMSEKDKFTITAYGEAKLVGFREPEEREG
ncbi:MAG: baseplate J/gp47 family protein [Candidatus Colwellbacteria bacterium]|nr:baseplate J/gp47 family protein [Candidatus Colwellbacteria bacterium]